MNRATPPVKIEGLSHAGVTAVQPDPTDFVNFTTQYISGRGGMVQPTAITDAAIPLWADYEKGRFLFAVGVNSGDLTDADITLWGKTPEGEAMVLGITNLGADGQFQPIEVHTTVGMTYAVQVSSIAGTTPNIDVSTYVQAFNEEA